MLGLELLEFVFKVLNVLLFAFAKGTLRGSILGAPTLTKVRMRAALSGLDRTYDAHIRDALFILLCIRSPSSSVFQLRLGQVCEFDGIDNLGLRVHVLRIGCWAWICVVSAVEATIHLKNLWSVLGVRRASGLRTHHRRAGAWIGGDIIE